MSARPPFRGPLASLAGRRLRDEDAPLAAEARFAEVLSELPAVERSVLALSEIGGLADEEIAIRLGTNVGVVESVLDRARTTARTKLRERRSALALLPQLAGWLTQGSAGPVAKAAGAVAAVVVGTGAVATTIAGDAAAEGLLEERPGTIRLWRYPVTGTSSAVRATPAAAFVASADVSRRMRTRAEAVSRRPTPAVPPPPTATMTRPPPPTRQSTPRPAPVAAPSPPVAAAHVPAPQAAPAPAAAPPIVISAGVAGAVPAPVPLPQLPVPLPPVPVSEVPPPDPPPVLELPQPPIVP